MGVGIGVSVGVAACGAGGGVAVGAALCPHAARNSSKQAILHTSTIATGMFLDVLSFTVDLLSMVSNGLSCFPLKQNRQTNLCYSRCDAIVAQWDEAVVASLVRYGYGVKMFCELSNPRWDVCKPALINTVAGKVVVAVGNPYNQPCGKGNCHQQDYNAHKHDF